LPQQFEISLTARAEAEIIADQYPAYLQCIDQHRANEFFGADACKVIVEALHVDALHRKLGEQFELLAQRRKARRRAFRREEFARMRLECHHTRGELALPRYGREAIQHCAMAEVHPIEIAHGKRGGKRRASGKMTQDLHGRPGKISVETLNAPSAMAASLRPPPGAAAHPPAALTGVQL
jgi:hypothetical protein